MKSIKKKKQYCKIYTLTQVSFDILNLNHLNIKEGLYHSEFIFSSKKKHS